ncbi:MAG TPA: MarR family transcriptional regulator [Candidatus Ornithomonoglobus merdipullorum]|uniref:MarR family transcriptional regulator n=1 Tax=Candidatus Ornithomonoglobus merdipullorum TaxID=2840895 RepID=A0A9D1MB37_9FIRM|nr:MarR family transcriptional regulator [Candidatus Ornithomonoglobus merdipullorum]
MDKPNSIGLYIKLIGNVMTAHMDTCLKRYDLTFSQIGLLHLLKSNGGIMQQKTIEETYGVKHTSVIGILQRMEKKGFLTVSVDPNDRRRRIVMLSESTAGFFEEAEHMRDEMELTLINALSPDERACLLELLQKLYHNLLTGKDDANDQKTDEVDP